MRSFAGPSLKRPTRTRLKHRPRLLDCDRYPDPAA